MNKNIIKIAVSYLLLFSNQLNASNQIFNISLSTSNDRLFVNTNTNYDIYGYQFQITNISLYDCVDESGSGFYVNAGAEGVLGVRLGSAIPAGENTILSCLITDNQAIEGSSGCCLDPDSIVIANGESTGGYSPQIPESEIMIGDCLYLDCNNEFDGLATFDNCGECTGGSTGFEVNYLEDCAGVCNGSSILDCTGLCGGTAEIDGCGECVGGNSDLIECSNDCSGNLDGMASYNECGTCICNGEIAQSGYTCFDSEIECIIGCDGNWENDGTQLLEDECGICGGDNSMCLDCAGVPNGTSEIDCLGICKEYNSEDFAFEDLCGNCGGSCTTAPIIDCECEVVYIGGINTIACTGNCDPSTYTDPCFIWNSETWVDEPGGIAYLYEEGEQLNDINGNGLADVGCYDCGGNYKFTDSSFDDGNIFREYSCSVPNITFNTQFYCSDVINNNIFDEGSCLSIDDGVFVTEFLLFPAYPNPFNPITNISYSVISAGNVKIDIYNVLGQHIYTLVDNYHSIGIHHISWNSQNQSNIPTSSGIYFIKAQYDESILIQELTLIK